MDVPKAMYKAQQAKKKMSRIEVAGQNGAVSVLMNGLNEIVEVEIDDEELMDSDSMSPEEFARAMKKLADQFKKAVADAKKQLEKEMMNSTSIDELKDMLGM